LLVIQVQSTAILGICGDPWAEECLQEGAQVTCSGRLPEIIKAQVDSVELCNWPEIIFDPRRLSPAFKAVKNLTINGDPSTSEFTFTNKVAFCIYIYIFLILNFDLEIILNILCTSEKIKKR